MIDFSPNTLIKSSEINANFDELVADILQIGGMVVLNGKITTVVTSNNLTVALKTLAGNDPSASDPVYVRIGNTIRSVTATLSVTKNAGTNWFNAGAAEFAAKEVDYFVYLGYNSTDGVVIGFARVPYARVYGDFSTTTTNETYAAISTITNAASTDEYELIGRFNAVLSAAASYNWSIPATSIIIQKPVYSTRRLQYAPSYAGFSANPSGTNNYYVINYNLLSLFIDTGNGTSNASTFTISLPMQSVVAAYHTHTGRDNGVVGARVLEIVAGQTVNSVYGSVSLGSWTTSGNKSIAGLAITYPIKA